jgi:hypothetical protein
MDKATTQSKALVMVKGIEAFNFKLSGQELEEHSKQRKNF